MVEPQAEIKMADSTTVSFSPFYTHFVLQSAEGWRYHSHSYQIHVTLALRHFAECIRLERELHYHVSGRWEKEIEERHDLPRGYLRGIFDIHRSIDAVDRIARIESERLRPVRELGISIPDGIPVPNTHANFVLVYKISQYGFLETEVLKEIVVETRARCTCSVCIPIAQPDLSRGQMYSIQGSWARKVTTQPQ